MGADDPARFGLLLRSRRLDVGLTQEELAVRAGLSARTVGARVKDVIGLINLNQGRYDQAIACHLQSLGECRELGHRWGEADALARLGQAYLAHGDTGRARQVWHEAIGILDDLCHPDAGDIRARLRHLDQLQPR